MQENPTYPAANIAAPIVEEHFQRHLEEALKKGETELAPRPDARAVASIINAAFWASFRPEEGRFPKISIAYLPPEQARQPLVFEHSMPLTAGVLTKLAPAVERPEIHLGVWTFGEELRVWGATRTIPFYCFVLEDVEPGLLVVKHRRLDGFGKYANVVVLKGEQVKVIDESGTSLPDCPALLKALLAFTSAATNGPHHALNVLVQLSASMRAQGHGGSLLVVPTGSERWRESISQPILYSVTPEFSALSRLLRQKVDYDDRRQWESEIRRAVDMIGGLLIAMWNYMGWDNASTIATEVERPQRTYPRAMLASVAIVSLSYVVPVAAMWMTGLAPSAWETGSWAEVASLVGGPLLRIGLIVGGMISGFGMFNALVMSYSRLPLAMSQDGMLPKFFSKLHRQSRAPWVAIVFLACCWACCLGLGFERLVTLDILLYGASLGLEFAALIWLRFREPELKRPFRVPGGKFGAIAVGVAPMLLLAFSIIRSQHEQVLGMSSFAFGLVLIGAGVLAYLVNTALKPLGWAGAKEVERIA